MGDLKAQHPQGENIKKYRSIPQAGWCAVIWGQINMGAARPESMVC